MSFKAGSPQGFALFSSGLVAHQLVEMLSGLQVRVCCAVCCVCACWCMYVCVRAAHAAHAAHAGSSTAHSTQHSAPPPTDDAQRPTTTTKNNTNASLTTAACCAPRWRSRTRRATWRARTSSRSGSRRTRRNSCGRVDGARRRARARARFAPSRGARVTRRSGRDRVVVVAERVLQACCVARARRSTARRSHNAGGSVCAFVRKTLRICFFPAAHRSTRGHREVNWRKRVECVWTVSAFERQPARAVSTRVLCCRETARRRRSPLALRTLAAPQRSHTCTR